MILHSPGATSAAVDVSSASGCEAATTVTALSEADAWVAENNTPNTGGVTLVE